MSWFKTKKQNLIDNLKEEQIYELVAFEVSNKDIKSGLWAKAYELAYGDEARAKAVYIKLRAEQIRLGNHVAEELIHQYLRQTEVDCTTGSSLLRGNVLDELKHNNHAKKDFGLKCRYCNGGNVEPPEENKRNLAFCYDCSRYLAWGTEALSTIQVASKRSCRNCGSTNLGLSGALYSVICKDCNHLQ
jgi:hypothetical protein